MLSAALYTHACLTTNAIRRWLGSLLALCELHAALLRISMHVYIRCALCKYLVYSCTCEAYLYCQSVHARLAEDRQPILQLLFDYIYRNVISFVGRMYVGFLEIHRQYSKTTPTKAAKSTRQHAYLHYMHVRVRKYADEGCGRHHGGVFDLLVLSG